MIDTKKEAIKLGDRLTEYALNSNTSLMYLGVKSLYENYQVLKIVRHAFYLANFSERLYLSQTLKQLKRQDESMEKYNEAIDDVIVLLENLYQKDIFPDDNKKG